MGTIVGAFGVPHMPTSPGDCAANPESLVARAFASRSCTCRRHRSRCAARLRHRSLPPLVLRPSARVRDRSGRPHRRARRPTTGPARLASTEISVDEALARHVYAWGLGAAFDLALSEEFQVDHSITVPVHFLAATDGVVERPIVPLWINGIAPPFPLASRCRDLGAMVSAAVAAYPDRHPGGSGGQRSDQR